MAVDVYSSMGAPSALASMALCIRFTSLFIISRAKSMLRMSSQDFGVKKALQALLGRFCDERARAARANLPECTKGERM